MAKNIIKAFFGLLLVTGSSEQLYAKDYYLDSKKGSDENSGAKISPWKSLSPLSTLTFKAGDRIFFAKGSSFSGGFTVQQSGTQAQPIAFASYGNGAPPLFTNPDYSVLNGNVIQVHGSFVSISGLHFAHTANCSYTEPVKAEEYWKNEALRIRIDKKVLLVGAIYQSEEAGNLTVSDCEFEDCPIAIYVNGQHNKIVRNFFHDCNRVLWDPLWGPIAVVIANAFNEVAYNKCINYKREGGTFGADGGFIELDSRYYGGPIHDVSVHHNESIANEGFMEITNSGSHLNISYNLSDDYQQFIFFWEGDSSEVNNNTVIRTRPANSSVNVVFTFKHSGYVIRNNIFVVADSMQVFAGGAYEARNFNQQHENNLYYVAGKGTVDPVGQPLGTGEKIADPQFVNLEKGNYRLTAASPAIDAAQDLGERKDFDGKPVPNGKGPDMGAFEYRQTNGDKSQPKKRTTSGNIQSHS